MKIIDLLQMIANDEEVPEKFELLSNNEIFNYDNEIGDYNGENGDYLFGEVITNVMNLQLFLNDEVEIIEEDKKIEKLNNIPINYADDRTPEEVYEYLRCTINNLANVINISNENLFKLIDKVNNMENDK